jgi:pilus assembly protein FimV
MMRKNLPADRAVGAQKQTGNKPQWRATALAIAAAALLGLSASDANALALGRLTVQSALGEPLRAEIEIPDITAEEVGSLRAVIASPEAFRAAGLEYNTSLASLEITLQRRADGRYVLALTSPRAVNEPFIDLILETNWAAGRIVRDYTLLFDPPVLRSSPAPAAAQVSPTTPSSSTAAPKPGPKSAPSSASSAPSAASRAPSSPAAAKPATGGGKQVTVQGGDTAGKIAAANKPANVSLDQMLVAMLQSNPDAFVGGNVNRLKSGVVLDMPTAEQAGTVPTDEAHQTIVAQSRDFNEFRQRLAENLPTAKAAPSERQSSGKVQAQVQEKKPAPPTPDKLTLSKGAVQGKADADKIARDRAAQDQATRVAELNKNIADLNKLGTPAASSNSGAASAAKPGVAVPVGAASAPKAATPAPAVAAAMPAPAAKAPAPAAAPAPAVPAMATTAVAPPVAATPVPAPAAAPSPAPVGAASSAAVAAAVAPVPAVTASAAAPAASAVVAPAAAAAPVVTAAPAKPATVASKPRPAPAPPPETSLLDDLLENPIVPASIGGVLALLLGFGFYRAHQRKKSTQVDSSFLESRLQPDSFFGASGGQRIDTNEGSQTGSSMVYSPSQLDAAGDVDPVAEADVYLAYGRDLQAEEILKEAMRTTPQRIAVHSKLLEIYSKRRDGKAFELVATEAYGLTHGTGPEWEHICQLGQELDPSNPLYRPGGQPTENTVTVAAGAAASAAVSTQALATQPMVAPPPPSAADIDLDLDFSLGDDSPAPAAAAPVAASAYQPTVSMTAVTPPAPAAVIEMPALDMDFGASTVSLAPPASAAATQPAKLEAPDLNLSGDSLAFTTEPVPAPAPVSLATASAPKSDSGMIEFDLGGLSLDLDAPASGSARDSQGPTSTSGAPLSTGGFEETGGDPLATKLALAQEFNAIGDPDGARSLAQEVLAEASGDLKSRAQRFLAEIS